MDGSNITGNNGSLVLSIPSGYYSGTETATASDSNLLNTNICSGTTIFGTSGSATCGGGGGGGGVTFDTVMGSMMFRDLSTSQITIDDEISTINYAIGYREVPNPGLDDEGPFSTDCTISTNVNYPCSRIVKATRPSITCGTNQNTISDRIADCLFNNPTATWNGASNGTSGEGVWKLVTYTGTHEVWQDQRTNLLWSDVVISSANWCRASGAGITPEPAAVTICDQPANQDQVAPESVCYEHSSRQPVPALGENWATGVYHSAKGGMGRTATPTSPSVRWRLPTRNDFMLADLNGLRSVVPTVSANFWTATPSASHRNRAFWYGGESGWITTTTSSANAVRSQNNRVRCVGRP